MRGRKDLRNRRHSQEAEVLRRIAEGETVSAACAAADMPNKATVYKWARKS